MSETTVRNTQLGAAQRLQKVKEALDKYEQSKGLPYIEPHNEANQYLNMDSATIRYLTVDEAGEGATVLAQFAFHIQRALNEERSVVNWCETEIRRIIFGETNQYGGSTGEERKAKAIAGNEYTRNLDALRAQAQARVDRLEFLPNRIDAIRMTLIELQQTKRRREDGK